MKSFRIALVAPFLFPERGACPARTHSLAEFLREKKCQVTLFAPARENIAESHSVTRYADEKDLYDRISSERFDLVWATSPPMTHALIAGFAAKMAGSRFVADVRDPWAYETWSRQNKQVVDLKVIAFSFIEWLTQLLADRIFIVSKTIANHMSALSIAPTPKTKFVVVPNGTLEEKFGFRPAARTRLRKKWNISPKTVIGMYAGAFVYPDTDRLISLLKNSFQKNALKFIFLVPFTKPDAENPSKRIPTDEAIALRTYFAKEGIDKHIEFIDGNAVSNDELGDYFSAADFGIVTLNKELDYCVPVKVYDYAGNGMHVFATGAAAGELDTFISKDERGGFSPNLENLAEKITAFISHYHFSAAERKKRSSETAKKFSRMHSNEIAHREFELLLSK